MKVVQLVSPENSKARARIYTIISPVTIKTRCGALYKCPAARLSDRPALPHGATSTSLHPARGPSAHYSHARCSSPRARRTQQSTASDLPGQARSGGRRRAAKGPTESSTCTSAPRRLTEFSAKICHARCLEFAQLPLFVVFMEQDRKFSQAPAVQPRGDGCRRV